jgi:hypothetical protein
MDKMFHDLVAPSIVNAFGKAPNADVQVRAVSIHDIHRFHG